MGRTAIRFLFGAQATGRQIALTLVGAVAGMVAVAAITGLEDWWDWVLFVMAFDIFGGIVSLASPSTRAHHASRSPLARGRFVLIHLVELPIIWWLSSGGAVFWLLAAGMAAKLSIYSLGTERGEA